MGLKTYKENAPFLITPSLDSLSFSFEVPIALYEPRRQPRQLRQCRLRRRAQQIPGVPQGLSHIITGHLCQRRIDNYGRMASQNDSAGECPGAGYRRHRCRSSQRDRRRRALDVEDAVQNLLKEAMHLHTEALQFLCVPLLDLNQASLLLAPLNLNYLPFSLHSRLQMLPEMWWLPPPRCLSPLWSA